MTAPRIALAATVLACVAATPAQAASRLVVRGAGFGHGVGMSQWGAMGYAQRGADHATILGHYYTGTQVGALGGASEVRVLLKTAARLRFTGAASVAGDSRTLDPDSTYSVVRGLAGGVRLRSASGDDLRTYEAPLTITGGPAGIELRGQAANDISNGRYRGNLELRPAAIGGVSAINAVGLEDYLRGVVPGEMPPTWPAEALRAQAVAARTYAIATSKSGDGFDQYADTRSQMYTGIGGERPTTDAAVTATRNEIVVHGTKPIVTYYFSASGGRTENVENSFLGSDPAPWLVSVDDPFDALSPRHRWTKRLTLRSAKRRLGSLLHGSLRQIKVLRRGASPRVVRAEIVGSGGRTQVSGPQLRRKLDLFDTWARFTVITTHAARGDGSTPQRSGATPRRPAAPRRARSGRSPPSRCPSWRRSADASRRRRPPARSSSSAGRRPAGRRSSTWRRRRAGVTARPSADRGCTGSATPARPAPRCASQRADHQTCADPLGSPERSRSTARGLRGLGGCL